MIPATQKRNEFIPFTGGLDVVTPAVSIPPGYVREAVNIFEDINGGYSSVKGYERFDGRTSPSSATYSALPYTVAGTVAVGDTIVGSTSGASAVVIAIDGANFIVTKITGTFVSETTVSGGATVSGPVIGGGYSGATNASYKNLAADNYRNDIQSVTGTGSILGVWYYKNTVYAFRNQGGGGVGMFKSSSSGWQSVDLGYEIEFSNANTSVNEVDTLTQGGVTATINRVVVETGTLLSGTNTGRLIISAPAGGSFSAGAATSDGGGTLTLSGAESAIDIPNQNGRFSFINANFTGYLGTVRMYGCDGENRPFEFDGSVFVPINCGSGIYPKHIAEHQNHLFVSYLSSVLHSGVGDQYNWTTTAGAGEIAFSDDVTAIIPQPGSNDSPAIAVYCRNRTYVVYGTDSSSWQRTLLSDDVGAIPYSAKKIGQTLVMDDRGVTTLSTAQEFGNFQSASISNRVKTWLQGKRSIVTDSHISRDSQQYRLFFSDSSAAYWTVDRNKASMLPMMFSNPVLCSCSAETTGGGDELIFFGSDNGYVYQMEKGTSFDGEPIQWNADFVFNFSKMYRGLKKYRHITYEMSGDGYSEFQSTYTLNYGISSSAQPDVVQNTAELSTVYWDSFVWDSFVWDGLPLTPLSMAISGDGENLAVRLFSNSDSFDSINFSGLFLEFSPLRMLR